MEVDERYKVTSGGVPTCLTAYNQAQFNRESIETETDIQGRGFECQVKLTLYLEYI